MITAFKNYLQTLGLSIVSRKLYLSDVRRFLDYLGGEPTLDVLKTSQTYIAYLDLLSADGIAPSMFKRTTASLRQFTTFLVKSYGITPPALTTLQELVSSSNPSSNEFADYIKPFSHYLISQHLSPLTIKSYKSDITRYLDWAHTQSLGSNMSTLLTSQNTAKYLNYLDQSLRTSSSTIERKSKSLARFQSWFLNDFKPSTLADNNTVPSFAPVSPTYSLPKLPSPGKAISFVKNHISRILENSTPIPFNHTNLSTLAILLVFAISLSYFGYRSFSKETKLIAAYPSSPVTPNRNLSFQGRLEDAGGTPITTATNFEFKLWNSLSGGSQLYTTATCSITPDSDGVFSTQIGSDCGSAIASSIFSENASVFLEVLVGSAPQETLTPRQPIASVAYALNSETLQGFPVSATVSAIRSTVVPMNQWGEILVGEQNPRMTGVSGNFQISAPSLTFTTAANGNIALSPHGTGQVNVNGGTTTTNFFNITNPSLTTGSLLTGTVANANTGFKLLDLLSGSSPASKFSVDYTGNTTMAGDLTVSGNNITLASNTAGMLLIADGTNFSPTTVTGDVTITGGGVTTIGTDKITESMLKAVNGPTDELCLTYESTIGDFEWQNCGTTDTWTLAGDTGSSQLISNGDTVNIVGGTNGIDTVTSATDTLTLNLDPTEISNATFGSGAGFTWTFDASAGTDTSLTFGNDLITATTASLALSGDLTISGNDLTFGNAESISNATNGTLLLTSPLTKTSSNLEITGIISAIDGVAHTIDDVGGNLTFTSNSTAVSIADDLYLSSGLSTFSTAVSDGTLEATKFCTGDGETNCVTDFSSLITGSGYWTRTSGVLSPTSLNDVLAATTSATTALTLTQTGAFNALLVEDQVSDTTPFVIDQSGNVGIGVSAPQTALNLNTSSAIQVGLNTDAIYSTLSGNNLEFNRASYSYIMQNNTSGKLRLGVGSISSLPDGITAISGGNIGINTTAPDAPLEINAATGGTLRLTYNDSNGTATTYSGLSVNSSGNLTIDNTGTQTIIADDLAVNGATSADITSTTTTATVFDTTVTTLSLGGAATTLNLGAGGALARAINIGTGTGVDTINIGTGTTGADVITFGNTGAASTFTFNSGATTTNPLTLDFDTVTQGTATDLSVDGLTTGTGLLIDNNVAASLTTGTLLQAQSVATSLTTAGDAFLGYFNWNPGSTTTATGDLFRINIGANGNVTNLLNITDGGTSLFSVAEAAVTSNIPASFTSAGDVSIAYDLNFTNPTLSTITSAAPLTMAAGETFNSSNLTLKTYNSGDVVLDAGGGVTLSQAQAWDLANSSTTALNIESGLLNLDTANSRVGISNTAPTANLDVTGTASISGALTIGSTGVIRSAYDNLILQYKSGANAWGTGLSIEDITGYIFGNRYVSNTSSTQYLDLSNTATSLAISGDILNTDGASAFSISSTNQNIILNPGTSYVSLTSDLYVNGSTSADILSTTTTATVFDTTVTTLSLGGAATTLNLGAGGALARAINIGTGTGVDTINIGTGITGADVITIGGGVGTLAINTGDWDIDTSGNMTNIGTITADGHLTLSGTNANIILGSNYLSGDGGDEGISVNSIGNVTASGNVSLSLDKTLSFNNGSTPSITAVTGTALDFNGGTLPFRFDNNLDVTQSTTNTTGASITAPFSTIYTGYATLTLVDSTAVGADVGAGITLRGKYTSAGATAGFGGIKVGKTNATSANLDSYISLYSREHTAGILERMRIDEVGNVRFGINSYNAARSAAAATTQLDIAGTTTNYAVCHSGTSSSTDDVYLVDCGAGPWADYMEMYAFDHTLEYGTIVVTGETMTTTTAQDNITKLIPSTTPYQSNIIGIVSNPAQATDFNTIGYNIRDQDNAQPLALSGRVLVKVTSANGPIHAGDPITSSSIPGVGMKATKAGQIIGKALSHYDSTNHSSIGTVLVYVNLSWFDPDIYLSELGEIQLVNLPNSNQLIVTRNNSVVDRIGAFADLISAKLQTGIARINHLQTNLISPLDTSKPIEVTAPVAIKPPTTDVPALTVDGEILAATLSARLARLDAVEVATASIDQLTAHNIVADTISANHIAGLDAKIASLSGKISDQELSSITDRIKNRLSALTGTLPTATDLPVPSPATSSAIVDSLATTNLESSIASGSAILSSLSTDFATINGYLAVIGQATMTNLDITNILYTSNIDSKTGTIHLAQNTLIVDSAGSVAINGDLIVTGKVLAESASLNSLELGNPAPNAAAGEVGSALGKLLSVYNESGVAVATIDASGSANLASLTTGMITISGSADATSSALLTSQINAGATAGISTLISPDTELTIATPYVTKDTLVYLTPTTNTQNKVLFVKSKNLCDTLTTCAPSFTVAIDSPATSDISFNWWIIQVK